MQILKNNKTVHNDNIIAIRTAIKTAKVFCAIFTAYAFPQHPLSTMRRPGGSEGGGRRALPPYPNCINREVGFVATNFFG